MPDLLMRAAIIYFVKFISVSNLLNADIILANFKKLKERSKNI